MPVQQPPDVPFTDVVRALPEAIGERPWTLVSSPGWRRRSLGRALLAACSAPTAILDEIGERPRLEALVACFPRLPAGGVVVALGGGSVIDGAKALVAMRAVGATGGAIVAERLLLGRALPPLDGALLPIIAIPTTAGSGSEATRYATLWTADRKLSIEHPGLRPERVLRDPRATRSLPGRVTLASGVDALSHACDAVWNRNATATSDALALAAVRLVREHLGGALEAPRALEHRAGMMRAAALAGAAIEITRTALAHSLSYPLSAELGVAHGLACGVMLPEVAAFNAAVGGPRLLGLAEALSCSAGEIPVALFEMLAGLGLSAALPPALYRGIAGVRGPFATRERAANNLRPVDEATARGLALRAVARWRYSTVTALARLRGLSMSYPSSSAT